MAENTPKIPPAFTETGTLAPDYFERLYAESADPWDFEASAYEAEKYAATLAALPHDRYGSVLELGCSIGVLTEQLAPRCGKLLAVDVSEVALEQARRRCADLPQVTFMRCDLAQEFPDGRFDLILVSEVGYYFAQRDLEALRARIAQALLPGGQLLLVHYTGETNYPLTADQVHQAFLAAQLEGWMRLVEQRSERYRLDLLEKA